MSPCRARRRTARRCTIRNGSKSGVVATTEKNNNTESNTIFNEMIYLSRDRKISSRAVHYKVFSFCPATRPAPLAAMTNRTTTALMCVCVCVFVDPFADGCEFISVPLVQCSAALSITSRAAWSGHSRARTGFTVRGRKRIMGPICLALMTLMVALLRERIIGPLHASLINQKSSHFLNEH